MTVRRALGWLGVVVLIELVARAIVYGLAPSAAEASRDLGGRLGGPGFTATLLVAVGLGAVLGSGLVWLASLGVRERWELATERPVGPAPRVGWLRLLRRALALTVVGWLAFAAIETTIHLQAGLGFHGLECLVGPVHRNALPVIGGIALLAACLTAAAGLVLGWMRRTVGRFVRPRPQARRSLSLTRLAVLTAPRRTALALGAPPRGPPLPVV